MIYKLILRCNSKMSNITLECRECKRVLLEKDFTNGSETEFRICISCSEKEHSTDFKKSFLDDYPLLKKEWDYERNSEIGLFPENLSYGSHRKVWWKCKSENPCHKWESTIYHRTGKKKRCCPFCSNQKICICGCNSLYNSEFKNIDQLRLEWDEEKNGSMKLYTPSSHKKVWWICNTGNPCHKWEANIYDRTGKDITGCPFCVNKKICICGCNSLYNSEFKNIDRLTLEWDEEKNGSMKLYTPSSHKKVWWICMTKNPCHKWESLISSRTGLYNNDCTFCSNRQICICGCNSLYNSEFKNIHQLRLEWDEEKNGSMKVFPPHSGKKVWWKCMTKNPCHKWKASVNNRTAKKVTNCPFCCNRNICECGCNSLYNANVYNIKQLRLEWDEEKNGSMKVFPPHSGKKVWWKCITGNSCHNYECTINDRSGKKQNGCPFCSQSKLEKKLEETLQYVQKTSCKTLTYELQKKFSCTKNVNHLPYDAHISYKGNDISVELQGIQHFKYVEHFHRNGIASFIKRLEIDNKKSHNTLKRNHCFLSISYLCLEDIEKIVTQFLNNLEQCDRLLSYYITGEKYLFYKRTCREVLYTDYMDELEDEEFQIYQVYSRHIKTLVQLGNPNFTMTTCKICNDTYLADYITEHYTTVSHIQNREQLIYDLGDTYQNLFTVTEDGDPVLEEYETIRDENSSNDTEY